MASGGPAPLARMYREQLGRRARSVGTVGLLPELNGLSFETEEYYYTTPSTVCCTALLVLTVTRLFTVSSVISGQCGGTPLVSADALSPDRSLDVS